MRVFFWLALAAIFAAGAAWLRSGELAQSGVICCGVAAVLDALNKRG